jgi:cytochrome c oxidase subunit 2
MPVTPRLRRLLAAALPAVLAVALAACNSADYPNSVFHSHTDFNRDVGYLFKILIWLGTIVFVVVEALLLYAIVRFRRRSDDDRPEHVHGNVTLEILWTAIPALILAFIAIPTVRTIFRTQARASADALQVEVIGHQWWWEFRYPQYKVVTANELYLPVGRTVNFSLKSADVLHSFSIPQLGGKRDLITNHTNFLWFTPDSIGVTALNGMCAEYCGASHANMRFKAFTVTPADFESWARHQQTPAAFGAVAPTTPPTVSAADSATLRAELAANANGHNEPGSHLTPATTPATFAAMAASSAPAVEQAGYVAFPRAQLPAYVIPRTPLPPGIARWNASLTGDPEKGRAFLSTGQGGCVGCHAINGMPMMAGVIGPNLTHLASRTTIAGGLYPNDTEHLALWIRNSRYMKPGVIMPTLGAFQRDPTTNMTIPKTGLSDQQIADIVAYLQALK